MIRPRLKWYVTRAGVHRGYHHGRLHVLVHQVDEHALGPVWSVATPPRIGHQGAWKRRVIARRDRIHAVAQDVWLAFGIGKMVAGLQKLTGGVR